MTTRSLEIKDARFLGWNLLSDGAAYVYTDRDDGDRKQRRNRERVVSGSDVIRVQWAGLGGSVPPSLLQWTKLGQEVTCRLPLN
jgi:hypothetical protein